MTEKTIKAGSRLERIFSLERAAIDSESRTVPLAFSSETPYERYWGIEVLSHAPGAVRLGRLLDGAPLLENHSPDEHIGVVQSATVGTDNVGRAVVRFSKNADADECFQDVLDGIKTKVSVGYIVHEAVLSKQSDTGPDEYLVTDWEPYEISLVSIPADNSVGVGRSAATGDEPNPLVLTEKSIMTNPATPAPATQPVDVAVVRAQYEQEFRAAELQRIAEIEAMGKGLSYYDGEKIAREFIAAGKTAQDFQRHMLGVVQSKPVPTADIGMTEKESRNFSFLRALNAMANPTDRRAQEAAAFEREASEAVAKKLGRAARGILVPFEVQTRDLTVGTTTAGGHTVATNVLGGSFIDLLRNRMAFDGLGATMLTGLVGNIAIPRQTGGATAYWVAESGAPTESQQAFDQVAMSPKTVGAYTDISRKLLLQSSIDVEGFVRSDLATVLALELDRVGVNGSGSSNQPTGILATSGIGSVAGGTNGLAPTWAHMVALETAVATANADVESMAYLTNAKVRGKLKGTSRVSGMETFVWSDDGSVNGYNARVSNQVPSNLDKGTSSGVCSAILFGNFRDAIFGLWGAMDLTVDPYSQSTSGTVRVVVLQDADFAVRHAESFAAMKDALTA